MPQGYLKRHRRAVGNKRARGGSSRPPFLRWEDRSRRPKRHYILPHITDRDWIDGLHVVSSKQGDRHCLEWDCCYEQDCLDIGEGLSKAYCQDSRTSQDSYDQDHDTSQTDGSCVLVSPSADDSESFVSVSKPHHHKDKSVVDEDVWSLVSENQMNDRECGMTVWVQETSGVHQLHVGSATDSISCTTMRESETGSTANPAVPSSVTPVCAICREIKPLVPLMKNCRCHPSACQACLRTLYLEHAPRNLANYPLQCFWPSCHRYLGDGQVKQFSQTREELHRHYSSTKNARALRKSHVNSFAAAASTADLVTVPCCCDVPTIVDYFSSRKEYRVVCQVCQHTIWVKHFASKDKTWALICTGIATSVAQFPRCHLLVSKGDGCDRMHCWCGHDYLYCQHLVVRHS